MRYEYEYYEIYFPDSQERYYYRSYYNAVLDALILSSNVGDEVPNKKYKIIGHNMIKVLDK